MFRYIVAIKTSIIIIIPVCSKPFTQVYLLIYNEVSKLKIWVDIKRSIKNLKVSNAKKNIL